MSDLKQGAKIYFDDNKDLHIIFASPDGQYFFDIDICQRYMTNANIEGNQMSINRSDFEEVAAQKRKKDGAA